MSVTSKFENDKLTVKFSEECIYDQEDITEIRELMQRLMQGNVTLPKDLQQLTPKLQDKYQKQQQQIQAFIDDGTPGMLLSIQQATKNTIDSEEFYNFLQKNPLISAFQGLSFESKKNTIDSVFIRNYLATLSEDELKKKEPLVWAEMEKLGLQTITPVTSIEYTITFQREEENVLVKVEDNGVGKDILDAFKAQHDAGFRSRKGIPTQPGQDNVYQARQGMRQFRLRTGGAGKGAEIEKGQFRHIGSNEPPTYTANDNAPDHLGVLITYKQPLVMENILDNVKTSAEKLENNNEESTTLEEDDLSVFETEEEEALDSPTAKPTAPPLSSQDDEGFKKPNLKVKTYAGLKDDNDEEAITIADDFSDDLSVLETEEEEALDSPTAKPTAPPLSPQDDKGFKKPHLRISVEPSSSTFRVKTPKFSSTPTASEEHERKSELDNTISPKGGQSPRSRQ